MKLSKRFVVKLILSTLSTDPSTVCPGYYASLFTGLLPPPRQHCIGEKRIEVDYLSRDGPTLDLQQLEEKGGGKSEVIGSL